LFEKNEILKKLSDFIPFPKEKAISLYEAHPTYFVCPFFIFLDYLMEATGQTGLYINPAIVVQSWIILF